MTPHATTSKALPQSGTPVLRLVETGNQRPFTAVEYSDLGYDPHGIIPPDAEISSSSPRLQKKIGTKSDPRGKLPGRRNRELRWGSYNWVDDRPTREQLQKSDEDGAGVGLLCGRQSDGTYLVAVDGDAIGESDGRIIAESCDSVLGRAKVRTGRPHRPTLFFRFSGAVDDRPVRYAGGGKVEFLSDKRQTVVEGQHPATMRPFSWPRGRLGPYSELPIHEPQELLDLKARLLEQLPEASIEQLVEDLAPSEVLAKGDVWKRASVEEVRRALNLAPNTHENFPTRRALLSIVANTKVALADDPDAARELVQEFAARYVGPHGETNDPDDVDELFDTTGNSAQCGGIRSLIKRVRAIAGAAGEFAADHAVGRIYFDEVTAETLALEAETARAKSLEPRTESPWDVADRLREEAARKAAEEAANGPGKSSSDDVINWTRPATDWAGRKPPSMKWDVPGFVPQGKLTLIYGEGGIGKTMLGQQYATAAATGALFLGMPTRQQRVMCFLCEDSDDVLMRRQADINRALGIDHSQLGNLRIASREFMDNMLATWDRTTGTMKRLPLWDKLVDDALAFKAETIILDAIADVFSGDEVKRVEVNTFLKAVLGRLVAKTGCTVIALGHPSVAGKASGTGMSGSTQWNNAVRSRLYLRYPKGVEKGNIRELEGLKSNYGAKGNLLKLRWNRGAFDLIAASVQPSSGDDDVPDVRLPGIEGPIANVEQACDAAVFDAVQAHPSLVMNLKSSSPNFAPRLLKAREPDLLAPFGRDEVEDALNRLLRAGSIVEAEVGRDRARRPQFGLTVIPAKAPGVAQSDDGVFE